MPFTIDMEQEDDGRWLAEIPALPGVLAYGATREEAIRHVQTLALRVLADRLAHGEPVPAMGEVFAVVACASGLPRKPAVSSRPCCGSGGVSSGMSVARIVFSHAPTGLMWCLPSMTTRKSVPE